MKNNKIANKSPLLVFSTTIEIVAQLSFVPSCNYVDVVAVGAREEDILQQW